MSRYTRGMKDGVEPIKEVIEKDIATIKQDQVKIADGVHDLSDTMDDIIDLISLSMEEKEEYLKIFREKKEQKKKPANFNIRVVYPLLEEEIAVKIRDSLKQQGNEAVSVTKNEYNKVFSTGVDFTILFNMEKPDAMTEKVVLFKAYGCLIEKYGNRICCSYDSGEVKAEANRNEFIEYYESVMKNSLESSQNGLKGKTAKNALKKRKNQKNVDDSKISDALFDAADRILDFETNNPIIDLLTLVPRMVMSLPLALLSLPVGLSEGVIALTTEKLRDVTFDASFVGEAQKQILLVKVCEYIKEEQIQQRR